MTERARPLLRVTQEDMTLFASASGDRNPLHASREYARRTPFGEPVVYGVLATLAALIHLPDRRGVEPASIELEFKTAIRVGREYAVESNDRAVLVLDVGGPALECRVEFRPAGREADLRDVAVAGREDASARPLSELENATADGSWAPSLPHLRLLLNRHRIEAKGFDAASVAALLCASYLVGMELPGERATLWKLRLDFDSRREAPSLPFAYTANVTRHDPRVEVVELDAVLTSKGALFATARISTFVRADAVRTDPDLHAVSNALDGKVAVVVGGSRGLGASLTQALARSAARVLLVYRDSAAEAERIRGAAEDSIELVRGDAADGAWCRDTLAPHVAALGGLDLLVCNAAPPIRAFPLVPEGVETLEEFVGESVRLAAAPLATFLDELATRKGTVVIVSSSALDDPPPEWPAYVTAKAALEGLASWVATAYPGVRVLVVRPPKLLTDQLNTVLGRRDATRVEPVAASIVRQLLAQRQEQQPERLDATALS